MRRAQLFLLVVFPLCILSTARSQTTPTSSFLEQAHAAVAGGRSLRSVSLSGTAEWIAGSLHATGNAQLKTAIDGSSSVKLDLGSASRIETQTKLDADRSCTWTDGAGISHDIMGPNCLVAIPWFLPSLFAQPSSQLPPLIATSDDGIVTKDGQSRHKLSYQLNLQGSDTASTSRMVKASAVSVFFDPQTALPATLEYAIHPDNDDNQSLDVRVVFSNYQSVSGVMLPFHIEKYVHNTLQLKLDVSNATIE